MSKGYNLVVLRAAAITLLVFSFAVGCALAQNGGAVFQTFTPGFSAPLGVQGPHPVAGFGGRSAVMPFHHHRHNSFIFPLFWPLDYGYDEADDNERPYSEVAEREPLRATASVAQIPPPKPQVIEIPVDKRFMPAKPQPPAIFILTSGEHLEANRFLLTSANLSIGMNRYQRNIPFDQLDWEATIAANHERGIELRVPADRTEISLSF